MKATAEIAMACMSMGITPALWAASTSNGTLALCAAPSDLGHGLHGAQHIGGVGDDDQAGTGS